jgi:hypothetical protein
MRRFLFGICSILLDPFSKSFALLILQYRTELRIWDVYPGSWIQIFMHPDLGSWILDPTTGKKEKGGKKLSLKNPDLLTEYEYLVLFSAEGVVALPILTFLELVIKLCQ